MKMMLPILLVIAANTFYNICAKQTPEGVNPFFSLSITYGVAMLLCIVAFFATSSNKSIIAELSKTNWASYAFGVCIVGLEIGYLYIYRVGWKVSTASIVANISLAVILLIVGYFAYKERISVRQIIGIGICAVGLILITKQ